MARNVVLTSITLRQLVATLQALEELLGLTPLYLDTLPRHLCRPSALSGRQQALLAPALYGYGCMECLSMYYDKQNDMMTRDVDALRRR